MSNGTPDAFGPILHTIAGIEHVRFVGKATSYTADIETGELIEWREFDFSDPDICQECGLTIAACNRNALRRIRTDRAIRRRKAKHPS